MSNAAVWPRRIVSGAAKFFTTATVAAAAATTFGVLSARQFGLRYETLALLPPDHAPVRILHISDLHLIAGDTRKIEFVRNLADVAPDVVVNTGDNPGGSDAVDDVLKALAPLLHTPGVFVTGSNDMYGPKRANPLRYLRGPSKFQHAASTDSHGDVSHIDVKKMFDGFATSGQWHRLDNRSVRLHVRDDIAIDFAGTGDAHMHKDVWPGFTTANATTLLRVAVTHAPYRRVLDQAIDDGAQLVLAGHTHGGQVALPDYGAIVSNCDLPTGLAAGLFRWRAHGKTGLVNVSAGIGASPTVPLRTFCRPEAVVLDLVPEV